MTGAAKAPVFFASLTSSLLCGRDARMMWIQPCPSILGSSWTTLLLHWCGQNFLGDRLLQYAAALEDLAQVRAGQPFGWHMQNPGRRPRPLGVGAAIAAWRPLWSSITWAAFPPELGVEYAGSRRCWRWSGKGIPGLSCRPPMPCRSGLSYDDVAPFAKALIEAAPAAWSGAATGRTRVTKARRRWMPRNSICWRFGRPRRCAAHPRR